MANQHTPRLPAENPTSTTAAGNRYARWALGAYWPLLFTSTHVPNLHVPLNDRFNWITFAAHFSCYAMLTVLLVRGFVAPSRLGQSLPTVGKILALVAAYGAMDEITQPLFGRFADLRDWFCDVGGAICAVALVAIVDALWARRKSMTAGAQV